MSEAFKKLLHMTSSKYKTLLEQQEIIKKDPRKLKTMQFDIEDINDDLHGIKFKADYEKFKTYMSKYKNTVGVLNKAKDFIKQFNTDVIVDFELDKSHYTTMAIASYDGHGDVGKVYLWKSTFDKPDYIKFRLTPSGECKITKIFCQEQGLGHKTFMFHTLKKAVEEHNTYLINNKFDSSTPIIDEHPIVMKFVADLSENNEEEKETYKKFFIKKGFDYTPKGVVKMISQL